MYRKVIQGIPRSAPTSTQGIPQVLYPTLRALGPAVATAFVLAAGPRPVAAQVAIPDVTLDSADIRASSARTLSQLLAGRVPGLSVTYATGVRGMAPNLRARGAGGMLGASEPLLYVDGLLVREDRYWLGPRPDRHRPGFTWELPVDEIESIEVYLGQSSGALMEFGASRGVVRVRTRRPLAGATRLQAFAEGRSTTETTAFPANVGRLGIAPGGFTEACTLSHETLGNCLGDGMFSWNPLESASPFTRGGGARAGVSASGTAPGGAYRASAAFDRDDAVLEPLRGERVDLAASWRTDAASRVQLQVDVRHAANAANFVAWETGILSAAMFGARTDDAQDGYTIPVGEIVQYPIPIRTGRTSLSVGAAWPVTDRVGAEARVGLDELRRDSRVFGTFQAPDATIESISRAGVSRWAADAGVAVSHELLGQRGEFHAAAFASRTTTRDSTFIDYVAPPNSAVDIASQRMRLMSTGVVLQERLSFGRGAGRTLGAGVRATKYAFEGGDLGTQLSQSFDLGWDLAAESFFPRLGTIDRFALRAAYGNGVDLEPLLGMGESGLPVAYDVFGSPPRVAEGTLGLHVSLRGGTIALDARTFDRRTTDLPLPVGGSIQGGTATDGRGGEVSLTVRDRLGPVAFNTTFSVAGARERIRRLGAPSFLAVDDDDFTTVLVEEGRALGELVVRPIIWEDFDGNGIIDATEVSTSMTSLERGISRPTTFLSAAGDVSWRMLSAGAVLDAQRGHQRVDVTSEFRCRFERCRELYDPETPLYQQALAVAAWSQGFNRWALQSSSFMRLRELWVRLELPSPLVPPGLGSARLTIAGHHLATWTRYGGADPEIGLVEGGSVQRGARMAQPLLPTWSLRLDLGR